MISQHEKVLPYAASFGHNRVIFRGPTIVDLNKDKIHTTLGDLHQAISMASKRANRESKHSRAIRAQFPRELFENGQMLYLFQPNVISPENMGIDSQNFLIPVSSPVGKLPLVAIGLKDNSGPYALSDAANCLSVSCNVTTLNPLSTRRMAFSEFIQLRDQRSFYFTDALTYGISFRVGDKGPPILSAVYNADVREPIDIAINPQAIRIVLSQE